MIFENDLDQEYSTAEIMELTGMTEEEVKDQQLISDTESRDYKRRCRAALEGGPREWAVLVTDSDSAIVRMAVAQAATEEYQLRLVGDIEPAVEGMLAKYSTNTVRSAMIKHGVCDNWVAVQIMKYGDTTVKRALIAAQWDEPGRLIPLAPYAVLSDLRSMAKHPDSGVRIAAALHGSTKLCNEVLESLGPGDNRMLLQFRLEELEKSRNLIFLQEQEKSIGEETLEI